MALTQPNSGHVYTEVKNSGAAKTMTLQRLIEYGPGVYRLATANTADLELADVSGTGVYETIPVDTSPDAPRLDIVRIGSTLITVP